MAKKTEQDERQVIGFLGVGFDHKDGHQRITHSEHFFLLGGSQETHEVMQDTAIRFTEALSQRGKRLEEATLEEIMDLFHEAQD